MSRRPTSYRTRDNLFTMDLGLVDGVLEFFRVYDRPTGIFLRNETWPAFAVEGAVKREDLVPLNGGGRS